MTSGPVKKRLISTVVLVALASVLTGLVAGPTRYLDIRPLPIGLALIAFSAFVAWDLRRGLRIGRLRLGVWVIDRNRNVGWFRFAVVANVALILMVLTPIVAFALTFNPSI